MIHLHNVNRNYRNRCDMKDVVPSEFKLKPLIWDDDLEEDARQWAKKCHNYTEIYDGLPVGKWKSVGKNIMIVVEKSYAVTEWMKQAKNYNHSTNRCLTGNSCDSYKR
ncbi:unnamed protein product, partial [Heterobilharzia americana]